MKRLAALVAATAILAGCVSAPVSLSDGRPAAEAVSAEQPDNGTPVQPPAEKAPATPPAAAPPGAPAPATQPGPVQPPSAPAPVQPPAPQPEPQPIGRSDLLKQMERVGIPRGVDLPAAYREVLMHSPWAVAQNAALWYHGIAVIEGPYLAPALQPRLTRQEAASRVWTKYLSSWEEGGRFYFHLDITGRKANGQFTHLGVDVVEVSTVEGVGPVVTGYAHAPWVDRWTDIVRVWVGSGGDSALAPRELRLSAPVLKVDGSNGEFRVPVEVLESLGRLRTEGDTLVLELGAGVLSDPMPTKLVNGVTFVAIADLVQAVNGKRAANAEGTYSYGVEWTPEQRQLYLWRDAQHPIS